MKLQNVQNDVLTNSQNESKFTINASAQAFKILSDGLYEHKIAAIVRELSCNAHDAHVEAGNPDQPFRVILPNDLHPYFEIEDFGIGLDDDGVREVYTSYFTSTKSTSNDAIGAFGLGSKTPFAYTTSFNIRARKDGVERLYTAYIGQDGAPCVNMLNERLTDEGNGVRITVPVKPHDYRQFSNEASFVLSFFSVRPDVSDPLFTFAVDQEIIDKLYDQGIAATSTISTGSTLYNGRAYAVMGGVCYRLSEHNVRYNVRDEYLQNIVLGYGSYNSTLFVNFDIGDLEVAASRETLSMDSDTEERVYEIIRNRVASLRENDEKEINAQSNPVKALKYVDDAYGMGDMGRRSFEYRGTPLTKFNRKTIFHRFDFVYDIGGYANKKLSYADGITYSNLVDSTHFNILTTRKENVKTTNHRKYIRGLVAKRNSRYVNIPKEYCVVTGDSSVPYIEPMSDHALERLKSVLCILGATVDVHYIEDLQEADRLERKRKREENKANGTIKSSGPGVKLEDTVAKAVSYEVGESYVGEKSASHITLTLKEKNFYQVLPCRIPEFVTLYEDPNDSFKLSVNYNSMSQLKRLLGQTEDMTLLRRSKLNQRKLDMNDVPFISDVIKGIYTDDGLYDRLITAKAISNANAYWSMNYSYPEDVKFLSLISETEVDTGYFDPDLYGGRMRSNMIEELCSETSFERLGQSRDFDDFNKAVEERLKEFAKTVEHIKEKYPMLKYFDRMDDDRIKVINDYVKMVDLHTESE